MTISNSPAYDAAMEAARLLGGNFKMVRERKRSLAVDLVKASVVEGFALQEAIKAAKSKMVWARLATDEQGQMNVLFTAVRLIDGAWKALPEDRQKAFLAGELVFSTLAKDIRDAEKKALEAEAKGAKDAEDAEANRETPVGEDGLPVPAPVPTGLSLFGEAMTIVTNHLAGGGLVETLSEADQAALKAMLAAVQAFEASQAPVQDQAQAA